MSRPFVLDYAIWHYTVGFRKLTAIWLNVIWFIFHFFSISLLFRTLLSPWKRMSDDARLTSIRAFFEALLFNFLSRIFGALVRLCIIVAGLGTLMFSLLGYVVIACVWLMLPLILVYLFHYGLAFLI